MTKQEADDTGMEIALSDKWGGYECTAHEIEKLAAMISAALLKASEDAKREIVLPKEARYDSSRHDDVDLNFIHGWNAHAVEIRSLNPDVNFIRDRLTNGETK